MDDPVNTDEKLNLIYSHPAPEEMNIPRNTNILLGFNKDLNPLTVNDGNITMVRKDDGSSVNFSTMLYDPLSRTITGFVSGMLAKNTPYKITISTGLQDAGDQPMDEIKYINFTTGSSADSNPPEVVASFPANGETVSYKSIVAFNFSEDMLPSSVEAGGIIVEDSSSSVVPGATGYIANIKGAVFFPQNGEFAQGETFTATVNPLLIDLNGNVLASSANDTITFQTDINQAPVAKAPAELFSKKDAFVTLDGTGSYDPEGDPLTYYWTANPANPETLAFSHNNSNDADHTIIRPTIDGFYQFDLVVDDGDLSSTAVKIDLYVGVVPTLLAPEDMNNLLDPPLLTWEFNYGNPSEFHLLIDDNSDFSSPIEDLIVDAPQFLAATAELTQAIYYNIPLYWKVSAQDIYGHTTDYSVTWFYQVVDEPPDLPQFTNWTGYIEVPYGCNSTWNTPCYFFEVTDSAPYADFTVEWEDVLADNYRIVIYKYGVGIVFDTGTSPGLPGTTLSYSSTNTFDEGDYHLRLYAFNPAGWTYPSRFAYFKVKKELKKPVIEYPSNYAYIYRGLYNPYLTFDWHLQEPVYYGSQDMIITASIDGEVKTFPISYISNSTSSYLFHRPSQRHLKDENGNFIKDGNGNYIYVDYWNLNYITNYGTSGFSGGDCEQYYNYNCIMDNIYQNIEINWKIIYTDMYGRTIETDPTHFHLSYYTYH
jgi:hypothetical protein